MDESQPTTRADLDRVIERIVDAFTANLSDLRTEMIGRFEKVEKRFDKVDERFDTVVRRLDRIETNLSAVRCRLWV